MGYYLTTARRVLRDAELALDCLEQEQDSDRFRVLWVAAISLSRMVGHVLAKVESERSDLMRGIIERHWSEWRSNPTQHRVFHDFIEDERNRVLKEYEFGFLDGEIPVVTQSAGKAEAFLLENLLYCPITDGTFVGEDCRDMLRQGIEWWKSRLQEIEDEIGRSVNEG